METSENNLNITTKEPLPAGTEIYQTDDGIIFYCEDSRPMKLYVKSEEEGIQEASLPDRYIFSAGSFGNALYFKTKQKVYKSEVVVEKIYKAEYSRSTGITVTLLRNKLEAEQLHCYSLCSRGSDSSRNVYRMCDDSATEGIHIEVTDDELVGLELIGIHRGKVFYSTKHSTANHATAYKLRKNVVVIVSCGTTARFYASESSRFVFLCFWDEHVHALDGETMQFKTPLRFENLEVEYVARVSNGEITVFANDDEDNNYVVTARLPDDYCIAISETPPTPLVASQPQSDPSSLSTINSTDP